MNSLKRTLYSILLSLGVMLGAQESVNEENSPLSLSDRIAAFNDRAEAVETHKVVQRFYYSFRALEMLHEFERSNTPTQGFNPRYEEARSRLQLGLLAANASQAIAQLEQVVALKADDRLTLTALINLAEAQQELSQFAQARASLDGALALTRNEAQQLAILVRTAQILRASGALLLAQGKALEALSYAQERPALSSTQALLELGAIAWARNESTQAQSYWQQAEEQALINEEGLMAGEALYWQARRSQAMENSAEALFFAQKAALFLVPEERTALFADVQQVLAELYKERLNFPQAFTLLELMYETRLRLLQQQIISVAIIDPEFFESGELRTQVSISRTAVRTQQNIIWVQMGALVVLVASIFFLLRRLVLSETNQKVTEQSYNNLVERLETAAVNPQNKIAELVASAQPFYLLSFQLVNGMSIRTHYGRLAEEWVLATVTKQIKQLFLQLDDLSYDDEQKRLNFVSSALLKSEFLATVDQMPQKMPMMWQQQKIEIEIALKFFVFSDANDTQPLMQWLSQTWGW